MVKTEISNHNGFTMEGGHTHITLRLKICQLRLCFNQSELSIYYLGCVGGVGVAEVVKASALLVEVATEPVQVLVTATKMDIGRPPVQKVPQ